MSRAPKLVEAEHASAARAGASGSQGWGGDTASQGVLDALGHQGSQASPFRAAGHAGVPPSCAMGDGARALVDHLYALSLQHLHTFDARGLANTAWAFAKMRYVPDASLPAALSAEATSRIHEFAAQVHVYMCVRASERALGHRIDMWALFWHCFCTQV